MRLLVIGDSLAFHGPVDAVGVDHPDLWPNVAAVALDGRADLLARPGWTARDAWWAVTRDPVAWSRLLPRADVLVLAVGGMDALPASIPTYLREGIPVIRPDGVRRAVRGLYRWAHPRVVRATRGRLRCLPQSETDRYLTRVVDGVRYFHPELPVVVMTPPPWRSSDYPVRRTHADAVEACRRWAAGNGVGLVDVEALVSAMHARGGGNVDGLHWDWETHRSVGELVAAVCRSVVVA